MTLLSICQGVANDLGLAVPTSIIGNTDQTAARLLAQAQKAGEAIARKPQGGWVSMIQEFDFTTAAVAPQNGIIANVGGFGVISNIVTTGIVVGTWYAFGNYVPANAIVTAVTLTSVTFNQPALLYGTNGQILDNSIGLTIVNPDWTIISTTGSADGQFQFGQSDYPLPPDYQRSIDGTMWDRSRYWQMRGPQSPQQWQVYKSSVIGQASVQRRFRFRQEVGQLRFSIDPVPTDNGSALVLEYVSNAWCQSQSGTPQPQWEADTDVGIVDEYLIALSVSWRMLHRLGLSYSEELDEYESQLRKAMAVDGGAAILSIVPNTYSFLLSPANIQEASFPS